MQRMRRARILFRAPLYSEDHLFSRLIRVAVNFRALLSFRLRFALWGGGVPERILAHLSAISRAGFPTSGLPKFLIFFRWCGSCSASALELSIRSTRSPFRWAVGRGAPLRGKLALDAIADSRRIRRFGVLRKGGLHHRSRISAELPGRQAVPAEWAVLCAIENRSGCVYFLRFLAGSGATDASSSAGPSGGIGFIYASGGSALWGASRRERECRIPDCRCWWAEWAVAVFRTRCTIGPGSPPGDLCRLGWEESALGLCRVGLRTGSARYRRAPWARRCFGALGSSRITQISSPRAVSGVRVFVERPVGCRRYRSGPVRNLVETVIF